MARNKEALIFLIDVGPSMHSVLPEVEKACSLVVQKKLIYRNYDEVGIVLFGTGDTDNDLTTEVGGYENVKVLQDSKVVDGDIVEALQKLPRGTVDGDFFDAVIVAVDMLIIRFGYTNKGKKRLCLVTNAQCPIKDAYEGSKEEQVTMIAKQMTTNGIRMESIIVRGTLSQDANKEIMEENDRLLNIFSRESSTKLLYVEDPISLFGAFKTRNITPVSIFNGDLEISPQLRIKVKVYKKTQEEKLPTMKKYYDMTPETDQYAKREVKVQYKYKSSENPNKVVPPGQRIKGYRYGPEVIPISSAWDAVKFKPEKGVRLLGFTDSVNALRHQFMKDVCVFIAEPRNTKDVLAVSALSRAMKEMSKVAILRCVWRQGQGNVVVGVLTPNVSDRENIPDSFYFNVLPTEDDVREFHFPSFSNFPASCQPNEQQLESAVNLIKMLDLAPEGKKEVLLPDLTPNPVLARFYHHLDLKSKLPDASVPPLDYTLRKFTEPETDLVLQNQSVIDSFRRSFGWKGNPLKKPSRISQSKRSDEAGKEVEEIGNLTPVQDFEAMISRRDFPGWVLKVIKDMKNKIYDIVEDSYEGDNYPNALECLVALRKGCILEQEPKEFNNSLKEICNFCLENNLESFCEYLASKGLTLISETEAIDSDVTDDEARSFLVVNPDAFHMIN